ncbi:COX15/CtaA family protein [Aquabacterium sp. OR-4]|uniref:COX15/CtaA family protein n=1 Tax=Aquabacterium sp. OR-4 TaxID=2978127 RepID=UPI0021B3FB4C|nr:COX15/CtaA family protein [Aquabacterium sp. OR-4]MDT7834452.1 COX15/CtaA family protein [Aquabacterium sp. OR-4]
MSASAVDLSPLLRLALLAGVGALLPLSWWWLRQRGAPVRQRLAALTALTLFLTFDLIVFGAFTRLTDSGLGCPDWPGCYGEASPLAAQADIQAAQTALPSGPVTFAKAWIEMIHRYLAMVVGVLILVATAASWRARQALPHSPWWSVATLVWVIVQGLFGKYTVTLKLYPAVVTLHLLGAMLLLLMLVLQHESLRQRPWPAAPQGGGRDRVTPWVVGAVLALVMLQIALGGWVSTNYAVMACSGFPTCNGQWWPAMDAGHGFTLLRELGRAGHGGFLPFEALVAIHMAHRGFALLVFAALLALAWALHRQGQATARRHALALLGLALLQAASGLSNVVLGWPIAGALAHSGGAAALVGVLASLLARLQLAATAPSLSLSLIRSGRERLGAA